jgi:hypothetical protein
MSTRNRFLSPLDAFERPLNRGVNNTNTVPAARYVAAFLLFCVCIVVFSGAVLLERLQRWRVRNRRSAPAAVRYQW